MKHRANLQVMEICANYCPADSNVLGKLQRCTKLVHFESFGYHGELLVVFGSSYSFFLMSNKVPYLPRYKNETTCFVHEKTMIYLGKYGNRKPHLEMESPSTPLRRGDFRLKKTISSDHFGPIEHLAWLPSPNLDIWHFTQVPFIHRNHSNQKLQPLWWYWRPRTWRSSPSGMGISG